MAVPRASAASSTWPTPLALTRWCSLMSWLAPPSTAAEWIERPDEQAFRFRARIALVRALLGQADDEPARLQLVQKLGRPARRLLPAPEGAGEQQSRGSTRDRDIGEPAFLLGLPILSTLSQR